MKPTALAENAALQPENLMPSPQNLTLTPEIGPIAVTSPGPLVGVPHDHDV